MKSLYLGTALAACSVIAISPASAERNGDPIADSYICVFKKNVVAKADVGVKADRAVRDGGGQLKHVYRDAVRGFAANMTKTGVDGLKTRNSDIAFCEQDRVVSVTPLDASGTVVYALGEVNASKGQDGVKPPPPPPPPGPTPPPPPPPPPLLPAFSRRLGVLPALAVVSTEPLRPHGSLIPVSSSIIPTLMSMCHAAAASLPA